MEGAEVRQGKGLGRVIESLYKTGERKQSCGRELGSTEGVDGETEEGSRRIGVGVSGGGWLECNGLGCPRTVGWVALEGRRKPATSKGRRTLHERAVDVEGRDQRGRARGVDRDGEVC